MAHQVKCLYCGKTFDRDKVPFIQVSKRRYAHKECSMSEDEKKLQENKDREDMTPEEAIKIIEENQKFFKEAAKFLHQYDDRIKIED